MLENEVTVMCTYCPYLVERAVVTVVRAALHLIPSLTDSSDSGKSANESESESNKQNSLAPVSGEIFSSDATVWTSLRLLRGIPNDVLCQLADRLGAGLLALIR